MPPKVSYHTYQHLYQQLDLTHVIISIKVSHETSWRLHRIHQWGLIEIAQLANSNVRDQRWAFVRELHHVLYVYRVDQCFPFRMNSFYETMFCTYNIRRHLLYLQYQIWHVLTFTWFISWLVCITKWHILFISTSALRATRTSQIFTEVKFFAFAKHCLFTGQEQACTRIMYLVDWLVGCTVGCHLLCSFSFVMEHKWKPKYI